MNLKSCVLGYDSKFVYFLLISENLWETNVKGGGLNNLVKEISVQNNTQAVAWILLVSAFSHVFSENQEQKNHLERLDFHQKGSVYKFGPLRPQVLERLALKMCCILCIRTIGKLSGGHLKN